MSEPPTPPAKRPFAPSWLAALLGVVGILLLGEGVASVARRLGSGSAGVATWGAALVFVVSAGVFLALHARGVLEFVRSIRVGSLVIIFYAIASCLGVLFKQHDLDRPARTPAELEAFYQDKFAHAQTYFVYHLLRPFGIGMPAAEPPPRAEEGLAWRAQHYGKGAADAQRKQMLAALSSREKEREIARWMEVYDPELRKLFAFCQAVDLTRVWKSDWFAALNFLLFGCVLSNWFRFGWRAWFTTRRFGFFLAHLGVLTLLTGTFTGRVFDRRGILELSTDPQHPRHPQASNRFVPYADPAHPIEMPFAVRLEDFKAEYRAYLQAWFLDDEAKKHEGVAPPEFLIRKGAEFPLDFDGDGKPRIRVRVKEFFPRVEVRPRAVPAADGSGPALAVFEFRPGHPAGEAHAAGHEHAAHRNFLVGDRIDSLFADPGQHYRIRLATARDEEDARGLLASPVVESLGRIEVEVGDGEGAKAASGEARVGEAIVLLGADGDAEPAASVSILTYDPNFRLEPDPVTGRPARVEDPTPVESRPALNPAFEVEVRTPRGTEKRWLFAAFDLESGHTGSGHAFQWKIPEVKVRLKWNADRWTGAGGPRWVLFQTAAAGMFLGKAGDSASLRAAATGAPLPLEGSGELVVTEAVASASGVRGEVTPVPGDDFFHQNPSGAVIEVEGPDGTRTMTLAADPLADRELYGERVGLHFYENTGGMPREWRSKLGVYDREGNRFAGGEIRVNDYLDVKGYKFFQTNADGRDTTYSGVGVVYDPGIPLVLLGLYTIIAGAVYAFFVRPILLRRRAS